MSERLWRDLARAARWLLRTGGPTSAVRRSRTRGTGRAATPTAPRPGAATPRPGAPARQDAAPRYGTRGTAATGAADVSPTYAPVRDGRPDPGEVVWTWVPYEEDPRQGKDRPVLVLAVEDDTVVALMLTSKDHDRDAADEARYGRVWMDVGSGAWDSRGRPSEVRLDRVLRLPAGDVRREGAALDRRRYDAVVQAAGRLHGW